MHLRISVSYFKELRSVEAINKRLSSLTKIEETNPTFADWASSRNPKLK